MTSGKTIRVLRVCRGLTQKEVAEKLGISQPAYSKIEKCKHINGLKLEKLLKAMNCSHVDLDVFKKVSTK